MASCVASCADCVHSVCRTRLSQLHVLPGITIETGVSIPAVRYSVARHMSDVCAAAELRHCWRCQMELKPDEGDRGHGWLLALGVMCSASLPRRRRTTADSITRSPRVLLPGQFR